MTSGLPAIGYPGRRMSEGTAPMRARRKPGFLWQGSLIVLPVVVLAAVGVVSLRQDKLLAQREAAERAQAIADDLLPKLSSALASMVSAGQTGSLAFQVDNKGHLLFPPPVARVPTPIPLDPPTL